MSEVRILHGDAIEMLRTLSDESVQMCVTSPPYYGLRQYLKPGHPDYDRQIGLERDFDCLGWARLSRCGKCFVCRLTSVFAEVRRVLRKDGTLWLNIGDSYANPDKGGYQNERTKNDSLQSGNLAADFVGAPNRQPQGWLKPKDLMLAPERLALSLQADGWYLRSRIIWHKLAPMPESVTDRPTKAHEHIWLLSKSERYYYDAAAAKEPVTQDERRPTFRGGAYCNNATFDNAEGGQSTDIGNVRVKRSGNKARKPASARGVPVDDDGSTNGAVAGSVPWEGTMRNWRDVWPIGPEPYKDAHFATFPSEIPRRAIIAGSRPGDTVLDPFGGSGTTGQVALELGRSAILIELNADYSRLIGDRTRLRTLGLPLETPT